MLIYEVHHDWIAFKPFTYLAMWKRR